MKVRFRPAAGIAISIAALFAAAPSVAQNTATPVPPIVADAVKAMKAYDAASAVHIKTFATLDFDVYSNQKWIG